MDSVQRAVGYIDGFNLYHAIDDLGRPHLKWVDLRALVASFLRDGQELTAVNYYSAYATWLPDEFRRHRQYIAALEAAGVSVHLSDFRARRQECFRCGAVWQTHEEKRTDVKMAVDLTADCLEGNFDLAVVVTADSDLEPAVSKVRATPGKSLLMVAPPGRYNRARDLRFTHQIRPSRIRRCLLPETVIRDGRVVAMRPPEYAPPVSDGADLR